MRLADAVDYVRSHTSATPHFSAEIATGDSIPGKP
jgi:hypothetical protein